MVFRRSKGCMQNTAATPAPIPAAAWSCGISGISVGVNFLPSYEISRGGTHQSSRREEAGLTLFRHRYIGGKEVTLESGIWLCGGHRPSTRRFVRICSVIRRGPHRALPITGPGCGAKLSRAGCGHPEPKRKISGTVSPG